MPNFFGYEKQWQFLKKSVELAKLSHAYLFSGKSQLGKREIAKEFSRLINCQSENFKDRPCGKCQSCQEMQKNCHPDFLWLDTKKEAGDSEIESIRNLSQWLHLRAGLGEYKVAIINQFQNFSLPAQSALLKTLEEPKGKTVLILICDYPEFLSPTIVSRVQEIRFQSLPNEKIIEFLIARGAKEPLAKKISYLSMGKPMKASELLDGRQMKLEEEKINDFRELLKENLAFSFREIEKIVEEKEDIFQRLEIWLNFLRIIFLERIGVITDRMSDIPSCAIKEEIVGREESIPLVDLVNLKNLLSSLEKANYLLLKTNANKRLILENSILELF